MTVIIFRLIVLQVSLTFGGVVPGRIPSVIKSKVSKFQLYSRMAFCRAIQWQKITIPLNELREIFDIFSQLFIAIMVDISKMAIEMTKTRTLNGPQ